MRQKKWRNNLCLISFTALLLLTILGYAMAMTTAERDEILKYAVKWCSLYNPEYNNYASDPNKHEDANFVSQALLASGHMFSGPSPDMDQYECILDRNTLELEVKVYLDADLFVIKDFGDVPVGIASGDVIFFMDKEKDNPELVGVIIVSDSDENVPLSDITVAYHSDGTSSTIGGIKWLSDMLVVYGKAHLYHFKAD